MSTLCLTQKSWVEGSRHYQPMPSPGCWSWTYMPYLDSPTQFGYYPRSLLQEAFR